MIASSILFKLPLSKDWNQIREIAKDRAKNLYQNYPGLKTKAFVLNKETGEYGGLYVWKNRESLDSFLISETFKSSRDRFGEPEIKIFDLLAYIEQGLLANI